MGVGSLQQGVDLKSGVGLHGHQFAWKSVYNAVGSVYSLGSVCEACGRFVRPSIAMVVGLFQ